MKTQQQEWEALSIRERMTRLAPFVFAWNVAFVLAWITRADIADPHLMWLAVALSMGTTVTIAYSVWSRLPEWGTQIPVAALCLSVYLMRASSGAGSTAGFGALLYMVVVWQAMRRKHLALATTVVLVTLTNVASVVWLPSPSSIAAQWRGVVLSSVVIAMIGQTIFVLVGERTKLIEQVSALALRDPLTGLANRRVWDDRLPAMAAAATRSGKPMTVAVIDLDHFKSYNDTFGHDGGDELLVGAADAWMGILRGSDLLVRWGGEEFALALPETDAAGAVEILGRLRAAVPHGQSFSAGYTVSTFHPEIPVDLAHLVRRADEALYVAKGAGRARSIGAHEITQSTLDVKDLTVEPSPTPAAAPITPGV